jgi:hypothetical protein
MNLQENICRIKEMMGVLTENSEYLTYVFNPKTEEVLGYNLVSHSDKFDEVLYDEKGDNRGYGWGAQKDDENNSLIFNSKEEAQSFFNEKNEKNLIKSTENKNYPDLSLIASQLRKNKNIDYQNINRGSCFKFAKEISKLGYNNFTFIFSEEEQEVIHIYIKLKNNLYWDANGFHKNNDIIRDYEIGEDNIMYDADMSELNHYCNIDTYESLTTIPISNEDWETIVRIIKSIK